MKVKLQNNTITFFEDTSVGSCGENRAEWEKKLVLTLHQIESLASQLENNPEDTYFYI